ncbi:MAG: ribosome recycling factor [Candidatus Dadabacteria bacterium]|nr:ribosome recycling factor [Candidatus Dadabacteria bacterium]NIQ15899.1 ribosome recycling factor [Candidatus Dadabacteria bacterium]
MEELQLDAEERMDKTVHFFDIELSKIRTGRASSALVESIRVDYFGAPTPMNQLANISIPEPTLILIQPWDPNAISEIEKAISQSDLGITPMNDGKLIRLTIPPLTEERRKELVKYSSKIAEEHRVAIRQIRKDTNNHIKDLEKNEHLPEDIIKKSLKNIQELTDNHIKNLNLILERKEKEILEI